MECVNEPEEGEIIDDYELISSDEEAGMRQRIRELEEKNAEIECISLISRSYDIDRAARIPTDVSSISSTEFKTPRKHRRHNRNKEHKKKSCHHHHNHRHEKKITRNRKTRCKRREKQKHDKYAYKEFGDKLALESPDSLDESSLSSSSLTDNELSTRFAYASNLRGENGYHHHHNSDMRDTLRLAVSRHRKNSVGQLNPKNGLKEKLFTGSRFSAPNAGENIINDDDDIRFVDIDDDDDDAVEICEPVNDIHIVPDESSDSLEEKELRLIALKSAMLKKHMERKRRNAEAAYSPTDFDEMLPHDDKLADIDVIDLEEDDSQIACGTASPIASPQLMLLEGQDDSTQMVDCKPIDMDIANSDSEGASGNLWSTMDIPPHTIPFPAYPPKDMSNTYSYGPVGDLYINEFPMNAINPPPPGVDDYEELKKPTVDYQKFPETEMQDMEVESEFEPIVSYPCSGSERAVSGTLQELNVNSNGASLHSNPANEDDLQEEEEELALRALLLAKFQSPKNQKKFSVAETKENTSKTLKPNGMEKNSKIIKPTEAILKEAVKRLQIHSQQESQQEAFNSTNFTTTTTREHEAKNNNVKKEVDFIADIPLPWNQPFYAVKEEKDFQNIPLPWGDQKSQEIKAPNEAAKEFSSVALASLQRKAQQLKCHNEMGEVKPAPQTIDNTSLHCHATCNSNQLQNLDEDSRRRLQKLKEEILSATRMNDFKPEDHDISQQMKHEHSNSVSRTNTPVNEVEDTNCSTQVPDQIPEKCVNDLENHSSTNVKAKDYDQPFSETSNSLLVQADNSLNTLKTKTHSSVSNNVEQVEVAKPDKTALKENNVNSGNKKTQKATAEISANNNKTSQAANKKITKVQPTKTATVMKIKETKTTQNQKTHATASISLPLITVTTSNGSSLTKTATLPTYSVMRTTKIVKPNKVINRNIEKRKVVLVKSDPNQTSLTPPTKIQKLDTPISNAIAQNNKSIDTSRLITSMDQVKHMCNVAQLVISVQNSSNESSDEEWLNCDAMYRPLSEYNDIASPLSLNMEESPCLTPRSKSPINIAAATNKEMDESMRKKHSPVMAPEKIMTPATPVTVQMEKTAQISTLNTPVAVRHLPASVQDEYRKLVHRMKMLENQRHKKESLVSEESKSQAATSAQLDSKTESEAPSTASNRSSLVKKVLLRNTNKPSSSSNTPEEMDKSSNEAPVPTRAHKANVLRNYESLYAKIGSGIVNHLDKSLHLVEEAKKAKVKKLKLEERLKELKAEMDLLQTQHKEEEKKMSHIYPSICSTNEVITSLKQKRSKILKAAIGLGKSLKGDDYRLNNDLKQNIMSKTKLLAAKIKLVNSLKAANISKLVEDDDHGDNDANVPSKKVEVHINTEANSLKGVEEELKVKQAVEENPPLPQPVDSDKSKREEPNLEDIKKEGANTEVRSLTKTSTTLQDATTIALTPEAPSNENDIGRERDEDKTAVLEIENSKTLKEQIEAEGNMQEMANEKETLSKLLPSYISPLEHLRCNNDGIKDPNGVICPYDLMGNCEDVNCKYVHISQQVESNKISEGEPS
ncbi:uncharacterized protein LOC106082550 isoform X1 [Stomoxys calcitrans]|uniref:uncharacterized protein LOC106082550 isoform X1 n=1 Tax=Stomoxys calcitrans TaxID=35570 RepID=UPI0027E23ABC|nr:uncharacterized protein LOC106082550 isoform X1 [Stomoxys calcitrans]